jgi:dTDP-4-dehydrorhamnose reductase
LESLRPDIVINCAAYNHVDRAETEPAPAFACNGWGLRDLAFICKELDCTLVHFSTDHVFGIDQQRSKPYVETDAPGPVSVYGLSKLMGEYFVRALCPKHFVIRTCGLYGSRGTGGKGRNFVETMLRLAEQDKPIRVVNDQHCTPSSTAAIAKAVLPLVESRKYGLYHVTNRGDCTWFEFARKIFDLAGKKVDLQPISAAVYGAAARRPAYSVLENRAYEALGLPALKLWDAALEEYLHGRGQNQVSGVAQKLL